jgi:glucosamine--fructose-6-phosphate aminotransferase (isomerizing)
LNDTLSLKEIVSQPDSWRKSIEIVKQNKDAVTSLLNVARTKKTLMVGCGSSYWGARSTSLILREVSGNTVEVITGGEALIHSSTYYSKDEELLVIVPTRSGHTGEIEQALSQLKAAGHTQIASVIVYEDTPIGKLSDLEISIPWASEESVCQTRSFSSLTAAQAAAFLLAGGQSLTDLENTPKAGEKLIAEYDALLQSIANDRSWDNVIVCGQGKSFGMACEGALILMEMSETHANYYHTMEVIHGPNVMASQSTLGIIYQSNQAVEQEKRAMLDLKKRGAKVLVIGKAELEKEYDCDYYIGIDGIEGDFERALVGIIVPQLLANYRAVDKGVDPDHPNSLISWIPSI